MKDFSGPTLKRTSWLEGLIYVACSIFILVLGISAIYDPSIRALHGFQALIYVAVIILARSRSAYGYGAGCITAAFWNWINLVHTTFIRAGLDQLSNLLKTGHIARPDLFIAVVAATAHFVLIVACLVGFVRVWSRGPLQIVRFFAGGLAALAYFVVIVVAFGPQYVPLLKKVFGI